MSKEGELERWAAEVSMLTAQRDLLADGRDSLREQVRALRDEAAADGAARVATKDECGWYRAEGRRAVCQEILRLLDAQAEPAREPGT